MNLQVFFYRTLISFRLRRNKFENLSGVVAAISYIQIDIHMYIQTHTGTYKYTYWSIYMHKRKFKNFS